MAESITETEIRLSVPGERIERLDRYLLSLGAGNRKNLRSVYADTPDFNLAERGIGLRLRREHGRWHQTIKVNTDQNLTRIENDILLPARGAELPSLFTSQLEAMQSLPAVPGWPSKLNMATIAPRFEVVVTRRCAVIATREGRVEIALDRGYITLPDKQHPERVATVCEVEIELLDGHPAAILKIAARLISRFKLWIQIQSKAERGLLLARGVGHPEPARARPPHLHRRCPDHLLVRAVIGSCTEQIMRNQSLLIAHGMNNEILHQLRVGLRRLRCAIRLLDTQLAAVPEKDRLTLTEVFRDMGRYRDRNYLENELNPVLMAAGGPPIELGAHTRLPDPGLRLQQPDFQLLLLSILGLALEPRAAPFESHALPRQLQARLSKTHGRQRRLSAGFASLPDADRHEIRKKLKFLRYCMEFFRDLYPRVSYTRHRKRLSAALENLGDYQDICSAIDVITPTTGQNASNLFALGWLKAKREKVAAMCEQSLRTLFSNRLPELAPKHHDTHATKK